MRLAELAGYVANVKDLTSDCDFSNITYDSRSVSAGDLFVCIKGARSDGHLFVAQAKEAGASCLMVERKVDCDLPQMIVPSTLEALKSGAAAYKNKVSPKVVAVTGSVGKTTVKEMIACVLSEKYKTHKNKGNMNSDIGMSVTLLSMPEESEVAVLEMGMNHKGEIAELSKIAAPSVSVITNIGFSHIENLGSRENILAAKCEITEGMEKGSTLVLNGDDRFLLSLSDEPMRQEKIFYGIKNTSAEYRAENIREDKEGTAFDFVFPKGKFEIFIPVFGEHNVSNALASATVGVLLGLSDVAIASALSRFSPPAQRGSVYVKNGITVIEDCYNASPSSMKAASEQLKRAKGRKIAVLSDMLELGDYSKQLHAGVGSEFYFVDYLLCYGTYASSYVEGAQRRRGRVEGLFAFDGPEELVEILKQLVESGDTVLFKGSRGMHVENVIEQLFKEEE